MQTGLARFGAFARRHALALWLVGVVAATVITVRTHYVADLSAFLPSAPTAEQAVLLDQLRSGVAARLKAARTAEGDEAPRATASAARPATCGVAIEVPESSSQPPSILTDFTLTPGAMKSTSGPRLENSATPSLASEAATAMASGYFAG